jgi:uncharacterized membrane protein YfcA
MDGVVLGLFLFATFIGGVTTGLAGFALGLVLSGVWLHILTPLQTATLIIGYGLLSQAYAVWKLQHALDWSRVMPFIISAAVGVPIGVVLLGHADPDYLRAGIGVLLVLYSGYSLARPVFRPVQGSTGTNVGIGFANGILGGMTGLTGIVVTIWCQLHHWPKDVQRTVFQPVNFAALVMAALWLVVAGRVVTPDVVKLFVLGLPALFIGMWLGLKLYGRLDEASFRRVVLVLLLISGLSLAAQLGLTVLRTLA